MQFGTVTGPLLDGVAGRLEDLGYDAVLFTDSQCRAPDVWAALGAATTETRRVMLGPGVTNTVTRDPAVIASAAASIHKLSGGRAILPIGRGDSAAHFVGQAPESLPEFDRKVGVIRDYLRSKPVRRGAVDSSIQWLPIVAEHDPIPIELVPSGPKIVDIAARHADRISFAVGSNPDYLRHFVELAKERIVAAGRDVGSVKLGAWINVVLNDDRDKALDAVRGTTGIWARFSLMRPNKQDMPAPLRNALRLLENYDMSAFGQGAAVDRESMPDDFVDWFSIAGDREHVLERLAALADAGLDHLYLVPGQLGFQDQMGTESIQRVAKEILPELRGM